MQNIEDSPAATESWQEIVENFLWQMDAYFEHVNMHSEAAKIRMAIMYLTDTVMLWWRERRRT